MKQELSPSMIRRPQATFDRLLSRSSKGVVPDGGSTPEKSSAHTADDILTMPIESLYSHTKAHPERDALDFWRSFQKLQGQLPRNDSGKSGLARVWRAFHGVREYVRDTIHPDST